MEAKKEQEIKSHFEEAAASYKRLLTGSVLASSEMNQSRPSVPEIQTTVKAPEPAVVAPAAAPAPVKPSVETLPVCRTYMEVTACFEYDFAGADAL